MKISDAAIRESLAFYRKRAELLKLVGRAFGLNPRNMSRSNVGQCNLLAYAFMQRYQEADRELFLLPPSVREERIQQRTLAGMRQDIDEGFRRYASDNGKVQSTLTEEADPLKDIDLSLLLRT